ncbi:MAG: hypothetical protein ACW963_06330, partial [Candidatus Sifarchaeia archaeon]
IDNIIEQNLLVSDCPEGLTLEEIEKQGLVCFASGLPSFGRIDMEKSLKRLIKAERVNLENKKDPKRYKLSEQAKKELIKAQEITEGRFKRVVDSLFNDADEGPAFYEQAFLDCLCTIFSRLGEAYVRHLKREIGLDELLSLPSVVRALDKIQKNYSDINYSQFEAAVFSFFEDDNPDYNNIKWNMAQNYYVAKALGLDPEGNLLSKEFFGNAEFYLDTNVLIDALEPKARHYQSFNVFSEACQSLKIGLKVCQISLDELRRVVENRQKVIVKVTDQIPEELAPKVLGIFYQMYREQKKSNGSVDLDTLFLNFNSPMADLSILYNVELVDDEWFTEAENQPETEKYAETIKEAYSATRGRPKGTKAALHDALLMRWIFRERKSNGRNVWLITLDTSLPGFLPQEGDSKVRPLAITLPAILQWISPLAIHDDSEDKVVNVFSEALKYQLLPPKKFFTLNDFLVFAEMEWSSKELPAEDIEKCIQYLKINAPGLDPSNSDDREKLAHHISKFFADPSRKYKQEVQMLETKLSRTQAENKRKSEEMQKEIKKRDEKIEAFERDEAQRKEKEKAERLKKSAYARLRIVFLIFIFLEAILIYFSWKYGEGLNFIQRVNNLLIFPSSGLPISIVLSWFIVGKERIRSLGWPFNKLLKGD